MSSTAHDLIRGAMRLIGAVDPGEPLTADEAADGLELLNELQESLSTEGLASYQILNETFTLTPGTGSYTIGASATFATTRPLDILGGFLRDSSTDSDLRIITREEYDRTTDKSTQGRPECLFYEPSVAQARIYLHYVPDKAYGLYINSRKQLQQFTSLTTAIVLPPGYKRMLRYNLALEIAPEYNRKPSEKVESIAAKSLAAIKRLNSRTPKLRLDHLQLGGSTGSDMAAFTAG